MPRMHPQLRPIMQLGPLGASVADLPGVGALCPALTVQRRRLGARPARRALSEAASDRGLLVHLPCRFDVADVRTDPARY
jgi:hypothetical protein